MQQTYCNLKHKPKQSGIKRIISGLSTLTLLALSGTVFAQTPLSNNQQVTVPISSAGTSVVYTLDVPAGATDLKFVTVGGSGDADLYVKKGSQPTSNNNECKSEGSNSNETCSVTAQPGSWFAVVYAYDNIANVKITGSYQPENSGDEILIKGAITSLPSLNAKAKQYYTFSVPADKGNITFNTLDGTGDLDIYVKQGAKPTTTSYDCKSIGSNNNESCLLGDLSGTYHIMVLAYSSISGATITANYDDASSSVIFPPFNNQPEWTSASPHEVATGGGIGDINGDGWDDLIVANGNDIRQGSLDVYYNNGNGTFPTSPSWSSNDKDFHGHLSLGDIDGDGDLDVVVSVYIGDGGIDTKGFVKAYFNQGNSLESTPSWRSQNDYFTFQNALGDADGDGDLDLVIATGNAYRASSRTYGYIFSNNNGAFETIPSWSTNVTMNANDVEFADMDDNGYLDVVFGCGDCPNYIHLANNLGQISRDYQWRSQENKMGTNSLAIARLGTSSHFDVISSGNNQLTGVDGKGRAHLFNNLPSGQSLAGWTTSVGRQHSSIVVEDLNGDGFNDLLLGQWFGPLRLYNGTASGLASSPVWTSTTSSVLQVSVLGDVNKDGHIAVTKTVAISNNNSHVVYLPDRNVESIVTVHLNGQLLQAGADYTSVKRSHWISTTTALNIGDVLSVNYIVSTSRDLLATNWDSNKGNYLFYNKN